MLVENCEQIYSESSQQFLGIICCCFFWQKTRNPLKYQINIPFKVFLRLVPGKRHKWLSAAFSTPSCAPSWLLNWTLTRRCQEAPRFLLPGPQTFPSPCEVPRPPHCPTVAIAQRGGNLPGKLPLSKIILLPIIQKFF